MAANKFASMLHKNCHKIIVILTYAVLEWILILLLLLNSFFSHLITKFADFFGLKPSCTWCSRLDHAFDSTKKARNPHLDHVCEAHGTEISNMSYCSTHNKLAHSNNLCTHCSSSNRAINDISSTVAFFKWMSDQDSSEGGEEKRCSCCNQIMNATKACPQPLFFKPTWDVFLEYMHKKKAEFDPDLVKNKETDDQFQENVREADRNKAEIVEDPNVEVEEWNSSERGDDHPFDEDEESLYIADMLLQNAELMDSDRFICIELNIDAEMAATNTSEEDKYSVLENEENSSGAEAFVEVGHELSNQEEEGGIESVATHEKAMNALYAELEEERRAAAEAAKETMAMITKLQEEKAAIQMEAVQYQRMMEEQAEYDQEALQLLNDLMLKRDKEKREVEKELQMYKERESSRSLSRKMSLASSTNNTTPSIDLDCYDHDLDDEMEAMGLEGLIIPDISLAEFDEERVSILEELKALEGKLLRLHDDGGDDSMAKKLLPLFDEENELAEETRNREAAAMEGKILIHEELGHIYERLQALEADKEFLKHCISSMIKGDQGTALVQEILQNLRDLKSVELSARRLVDTPLSDAAMPEEDHQENGMEMLFSST